MTGRTGPRPMAHPHSLSYHQGLQSPAGYPTPAHRCRPSWSQPAATSSHRVSIDKSSAAQGCELCGAQLALLCCLATFNGAMSVTLVKLYQEVGPLLTIAGGVSLGLLWSVWLSSTSRWLKNLRLLA